VTQTTSTTPTDIEPTPRDRATGMVAAMTPATPTEPHPIIAGTVDANGLTFATLSSGDPSGPLALCLHGFPDSAWTWRHLLGDLAAAGFHAVAPFLRGYAPTDVPADGLFQTGAHAADALALHQALGGGDDAVLVGHDVGAIAAYAVAAQAPERWHRMVTLAIAPPSIMAQQFLSYDQLRRSWYTFFFQTPLAEVVVPMDDHAFIDRIWADWSPGFDGGDLVVRAKEALAGADRLGAALGWYRATLGTGARNPDLDAIEAAAGQPSTVPVLYLHGTQDGCFAANDDPEAARTALGAEGSRVAFIDGVGHFLHLERPELVNQMVLEFVTA